MIRSADIAETTRQQDIVTLDTCEYEAVEVVENDYWDEARKYSAMNSDGKEVVVTISDDLLLTGTVSTTR